MSAVVKAVWSGFGGSPGTSTFLISDATFGGTPSSTALTSAVAAIRQFFNACASQLAASVVISFDGSASAIDPITGHLTGTVTYTPPSSVAGTGASSVAAPAGASVRWRTAAIGAHRAVTGRTYLVPLYAGAYEANGSLQSSTITQILTAGNALIASSAAAADWEFMVWSRPVGGTGGGTAPVTGCTVKDTVAILTSRRD